jgi:hypothetical protein
VQLASWYLLVTAIAIPVGNAIFAGILGLVAAHVGKNATQYAANLQAAQRRRDIEIAQLREAQEHLITAATACQSFTWHVDKPERLRTKVTPEEWDSMLPHLEPAVHAAQRLRALAPTLPTESLRNAYIEVEELIMAVGAGSDDDDAPDPWGEATHNQPDPITRAIKATADEIKRLYDTYPDGE